MLRLLLPALLQAALLAAPAAAQIKVANPASDQIRAYPDIQRRAVLRGIVMDGGAYCKRVEQAGLQGPWGNLMMWRAKCDPTDARLDYAVFIGADATAQVRPCADMAALKLPVCRPFPPIKASAPPARPAKASRPR